MLGIFIVFRCSGKECMRNEKMSPKSNHHNTIPLFSSNFLHMYAEMMKDLEWDYFNLFYFFPFDDSKLCDKSVNFSMSQPKVPCRCYDDGGPEAHDRILTQFYGFVFFLYVICLLNHLTSHKV